MVKKETTIEVIKKFGGDEKIVLSGQIRQISQLHYKVQKINGEIVPGKLEELIHPLKHFLYTFNEKGIKTGETTYNENGIYCKQLFNDDGKLTALYLYNKDGGIHIKSIRTVDESGNETDEYVTDDKDNFQWRHTHKYDSKGNCTEQEMIYAQVYSAGWKHTYIYDENNFKIESFSYDENGKLSSRSTFKNDEKGNSIEHNVYLPDGRLANTFIDQYNYDEAGNRVIPLRKIPPGGFHPFHTYEHEYDHQGNWIKQTAFYNKQPIGIVIREINYFDEPPKDITVTIAPATNKIKSIHKNMENNHNNNSETNHGVESSNKIMNAASAKWVAEVSTGMDFSAFRYYVALNNDVPSEKTFATQSIDALALKDELEENMDAIEIHTYHSQYEGQSERMIKYTLGFPNNCYFLHAMQIQTMDADKYDLPDFVRTANNNDGTFKSSQFKLIHPGTSSGKRDLEFESMLNYYIDLCTVQKLPDQPEIYMVQVNNGSFSLQSHPVDDSFEIKNLDRNYGYGFEKFHAELMQRFQTETKGLVLFHGEPGTGKTYYIRHLLRSMANNNKIVIYMPPNMVDRLVEPGFMTFISQQVSYYSQDGYFCALLIEDAEPLLAARNTDTRIQGVTNLLNMTDGLLNDMLNLQIICTFNVGLKKLDKALLRPGRLLARKEFKAMSELDANILAQQLGVKHHFTKPATLSEVYALVKNKHTLIHDVDENGADVSE